MILVYRRYGTAQKKLSSYLSYSFFYDLPINAVRKSDNAKLHTLEEQ